MFISQIEARSRLHANLPRPARVNLPGKRKRKPAFWWARRGWAKTSGPNRPQKHGQDVHGSAQRFPNPREAPQKQCNAAAHLIKPSPPLNLPCFLLYPANTLANFPFGRGKEIPLEPAVFLFPIWQINQSSRLTDFRLHIPLLQLSGSSWSYFPAEFPFKMQNSQGEMTPQTRRQKQGLP